MKKRLLSILLAAVMVLSAVPLGLVDTAYAASSGTCGDKLTWSLSDDGTLTISGTGDMAEYSDWNSKNRTPWYDVREQVKTVFIKDSVTSIGNWAFYGCVNLTNVTIPDSVTSIGYAAFSGCSVLTGVTIPDGVTKIGYYAFSQCEALTSVTIPSSVTSIGNYAFFLCSALTSVTIPSSVTTIGNGAFSGCDALTGVTIPSTVTAISDEAFRNCEALTSVTIPNSVTTIGDYAFSGCDALSSVTIPNSVTKIGGSAFYGCKALTGVTIPASVTSIGDGAFAGGSISVNVSQENKNYCSVDGGLFDKQKTTIFHPGKIQNGVFRIPDGVTSIGDNAFSYCFALSSVTIPSSVTSIGDYAFSCCFALSSVTIPDGVTSIGHCAFYNCSSLTGVTIPGSVTSIGYNAFSGCSALIDIYYGGYGVDWLSAGGGYDRAPENATVHFKDDLYGKGSCGDNVNWVMTLDGMLTISGKGAMTDTPWRSVRSQVKNVVIENGVTSIGDDSFRACTSLTSVTIPGSVTSIGSRMFYGCTSLTSVTIPDGVTSIGYYAFSGCSALTSVTIPGSVTSIGYDAFSGCSALIDIYYGGYGVDWLAAGGGYDRAPENATVHYKDDLYGKGSCGDNANWVMTLDGTLTISGTGAMVDYESWGDNTPWRSVRAQVKNVVIENGVTSIGNYAFYDCDVLTSVTIPDSVTSIGDYVFSGCSALTDIYYGGYGVDWLKVEGYDSVRSDVTVHFKDDLYGKGECGDNVNWVMTFDGTLTISGKGAITDTPWRSVHSQVKNVVIENGVTSIGDDAFKSCDALTSVTISGSVTSLGYNVFSGCSALTDIYYGGYGVDWMAAGGGEDRAPENTTVHFKDDLYGRGSCGDNVNWVMTLDGMLTISGKGAITDTPWRSVRSQVKNVVIENGVTSIGAYAFYSCSSLTSVTIPGSVTSIGAYAFSYCSTLTDIYYDGYGVDWAAIDGTGYVPSGVAVHFKDDLYGKGACGDNVNWVMTLDGTLTISGPGDMKDYNGGTMPWDSVRLQVKNVVIENGVTSIGAYAFYNCTALTNVTIPGSVTSIGDSAFSGCDALTSVTIPNSVTTIGDSAFCNCKALPSVTIPGSVTSIGWGAFYGCTSLTSVTIPDSVTSIGVGAFSGCSSLTSVTILGGVTSIGDSAFSGCDALTSVTIPNSVTTIGDSAFYNCKALPSVTIPGSVTSIGDRAFYGCNALTSVTIPDSVTSIGWGAFYGCTSLTSVTIPDSVTSIGAGAFLGCSSLTSVTIPNSVTSIGWSAFKGCTSLTSVMIPHGVTSIYSDTFGGCTSLTNVTIPGSVTFIEYSAFSGCSALTDIYYGGYGVDWLAAGGSEDRAPKNATVHFKDDLYGKGECGDNVNWVMALDGMLTISGTGTMADYESWGNNTPWRSVCSQVKNVVIENGVTSIGDYAFYNCSSLTSVTIPTSVTRIGYYAFDSGSALTDIYYDGCGTDWLDIIGYGSVPSKTTVHFKDDLYGKGMCGDTVSWVLPLDGTLTISGTGTMADYESWGDNTTPWRSVHSQVKNVVIENGVTSIGDNAFYYCGALTRVTIPDSMTTIGESAFGECDALPSVTIPSSVTSIGREAFYNCSSLTSVTIPRSVTSIGNSAFSGGSALTDIYYGGYGVDWLEAGGGYDRAPENATVHFKDDLYGKGSCGDNVKWAMTLDGMLTISGKGAMTDTPWRSACSQVKNVVIENGVTSIGEDAFYNCSALPSVTIPASVTTIGDSAFSYCSSLTSVTIPDSVTNIGDDAFYNCSALTSVTIPCSVTSIGRNAFYYCDALTDIYYGGYGVDWLAAGGGYDRAPENATVHFKDDLYGRGSCGDDVNWVMTLDGMLTISGKGAMTDTPWCSVRSQVKNVVIENGVTSIGDGTFYNCSSLTSVTIPDSVTTIGESAFGECDALPSVTIPASVTTIGDYAFSGCDALTSVTIPSSVTSIGRNAFGSSALTDIYYGGYGVDWLAAGGGYDRAPENATVHFKDDLYGKGECGLNVNWVMTLDGTLTISGTGRISNYQAYNNHAPWRACCKKYIKSIVIESGVTGIGDYAFFCCEALTSVVIPSSVTTIGDGAFSDCIALTSITIPNSVTSIGGEAFENCWGLTSVTIPSGVTAIENNTFSYCSSLANVSIPSSVESIGDWAFRDCDALTSVTIPNSVTYFGIRVFSGCSALKSVTFSDGVTSVGYEMFGDCTSLTDVTIPNSVTSIGSNAFEGCTSLTNVTIPNSVTSMGNNVFKGCTALTELKLPSALEDILSETFSNCVRLTSITIPKSVTYIGEKAFYYCDSLTDIYYTGTADDWAKITVASGNGDLTSATLHCAKSAPVTPVVKIGNSATSGKPMLTWHAVYGATSYRIYRSTAKGSGYSLLGTTTATSYTNTGAKAGTTYYYKVKAVNSAGESAYSSIVSGQVKSVTPKPSAPVVKIGNSSTSGKPMLTWNAVSGATSYKVYRATSQSGTYSLLGTVTVTSYTNTGAKAGTTYYYKVKAVNSAGESAYSNIVSGRATVTTLTMGHSSVSGKPMLTWKSVSGAASYKVYRATSKTGAYSVINTTKALTYTNTGAALGTTYYYKVEALNSAGKSMGFSAIVEGKVAPVLAVGYSSVSGKPQLTWKAVPGATEYQVYRSTQQNSGYSKINTTTSTSYVNTGAKAGTTYYYRIVAVKGTAVSDFSNIVSARPGK